VTPSRRRPVVSYWHDTYRVSERRACRVARLPVSTFRYEVVVVCPEIHDVTGKLRSVVAEDELWTSSLLTNLIQSIYYIVAVQPLPHFDRKTFPREQIQHGQGSKAPPVG
jgi:hypothetical protein